MISVQHRYGTLNIVSMLLRFYVGIQKITIYQNFFFLRIHWVENEVIALIVDPRKKKNCYLINQEKCFSCR